MAGTMSIGGLASGIKTDDIISKYMEIARRPQQRLEQKKTLAQQRLTAWQDLNTRVLALQAKSSAIASTSAFQTKSATSNMEDIAKVSASADATAGTYYLNVNKTAKSHQIASQTYSGLDNTVSEGTIKITVDSKPVEVKITSANNTLLGVKDAINKANAGVRASVVNKGTANSPEYILVLTSNQTGTDHKMVVDAGTTGIKINSDKDGAGDRQVIQVAEDAEIQMGSLTFKRSSNSVNDVIPGVTLNIVNADPAKTVKVEVANDTNSAKTAIQSFVDQYNDIVKAIRDLTMYDSETGDTGIMLGNFQIQSLQMDLQSAVTGVVPEIARDPKNKTYNSLASIGVTTGLDGTLSVDNGQLDDALNNNSAAVAKLFGTTLDSDNSYFSLAASTSDTKSSGIKGYNVDITQPATRGSVTAGAAMDAPLAQDENLTINERVISLKAGMTADQVIAEINKNTLQINMSAYLTTKADSNGVSHNYLSLRALQYGSGRTFSIKSDVSASATSTGLGTVGLNNTTFSGETGWGTGEIGKDVAGTINGEAATGKGQVLAANPSSATSPVKGLSVLYTGTTSAQTDAKFVKGIGTRIRELLTSMTSSTGFFSITQKSINSEIDAIDKDIATMETRLQDQQDQMSEKFNAMETQMSSLQQQGNYLASQLASLNKG